MIGFQKGINATLFRENNIPDLLKNYRGVNCDAPCTLINIKNVNDTNFYNLTPEFYLNYYGGDYRDVEVEEYKSIIHKLKQLNKLLENPFA